MQPGIGPTRMAQDGPCAIFSRANDMSVVTLVTAIKATHLPSSSTPSAVTMRNRPPAKTSFVEPMHALSVSSLSEGPDWLYEVKFDGYRYSADRAGKSIHRSITHDRQRPSIASFQPLCWWRDRRCRRGRAEGLKTECRRWKSLWERIFENFAVVR